ncbi:MAG TPA: 16S rRNA (adenine(1518)-N(6)/adenine(1519)-N(6))-dimethyltransferase RsmA [Microthrixaceae bacterium]|nr:16S rRNA (adenine(1518)-N(6)/adenine(1519)-N(6))-dimethyltransferase RsmA [Microthrixaceae bacterium]HMX06785.1 16S rRNA (adenine(1518)-N(6)/adenine(1519)-N(6))-dimethyltransferase RsmA [Microthrixaceae bacterium]HMX64935.1 16S rRNA (adenine(1518)-N(6)/adenine(1519)-N(6))-dimethyltransferase RsmA [Microthrixaceae bacterium]HMY86455.1 16S rRNA (adenine(1518)-N(6)/adenine(1519)-N(6))-dimethyltransferase RsmA [Microthrixaceae bacterium]HNA36221.1 16S rRNA (adenine(1518)-N(6)/adenine(1519)-N(6))
MLGRTDVDELLARHGLAARRSLGQNFVADPNTVRAIARRAAVGPGDRVVEIGPGLGSLTLALAETGAEVLAVEKDRSLLPVLTEVLAGSSGVCVVQGDATTIEWDHLLGVGPWVLVANLPYNVAVPLTLRVLCRAPQVERLVVMVQREVADRLCASPGGRTIGVPSIKVAWWASARIAVRVGPEVFVPRPRVESAVVELVRHPPPSTRIGPRQLFPLVEQAYRQRRKMLRSTLAGSVSAAQFASADVDATARPEQLGLEEWVRLAEVVALGDRGGAR